MIKERELQKKQLKNMINSLFIEKIDIKIEEIERNIIELSQIPMFKDISREELNDIRKEILSNQVVSLELGTYVESKGYKYKKWFLRRKADIDFKYWNRYRKYLIQQQGFSPNVVNGMDNILDDITDLLGNPEVTEEFQRRGLIVGDVQSGKTSNYAGLICKAIDSGYKVIVLLTGTIEKLRRQTQIRLDESVVGFDSAAFIKDKKNSVVGVGNYGKCDSMFVLTSTENDFNKKVAMSVGVDLNSAQIPILLVLKKNVSTLKHLNMWLKQFNKSNTNKINNSLLLVDDEADNASINTNKEENDPTKINAAIRTTLGLFNKASYVGFTATPFANIFIDPDSDEEMLSFDLFPKDYIYSLNAPTNYIGARNIFIENASHEYMQRIINEEEIVKIIPLNHKKDLKISEIPSDLKEAIKTFLVANAIRDLRGNQNTHRSMLINMSRFVNVQRSIKENVDDYLKEIQQNVRLYNRKDHNNKYIKELKQTFENIYINSPNQLEFTWEEICEVLDKAILPITTKVVNEKSADKLNYEEYEEGLRVIAIGGLSLSRGLTLEGLMCSYFYRNSKMYDTLMQMGRWFGYRGNYEDLCRIWMTEEAISWYEYISCASDELREEIKRYQNNSLTPMDFGLRVRSDINTLLVTAKNKMRTATSREFLVTLSGEVLETPYMYIDENNKNNLNEVENLVRILRSENIKFENEYEKPIFRNIKKNKILKFLEGIEVPVHNIKFNTSSIIDFIKDYNGEELENWDIAFATGSGEAYELVNKKINLLERSVDFPTDNIMRSNGTKKRLGSIADGKIGIRGKLFEMEKNGHFISISSKFKSQKDYFKIKRNPIILIYLVNPKKNENKNLKAINEIGNNPIVGFAIGIPELSNTQTKYAKYTWNKIQEARYAEDEVCSYNSSSEIGDEEE
ncbi:MAG: Z1 domain-containing protein [Sarcina sp.]